MPRHTPKIDFNLLRAKGVNSAALPFHFPVKMFPYFFVRK